MKKERGQSLVELSVSLVVLMYLLSGAVEFGIIFFQFVQLRDAVQEGALYASGSPSRNVATIETRARGASNSPIHLQDAGNNVTFQVTAANQVGTAKDVTAACEGDSITVEAIYPHHIFMPFLPQILRRSDITIHAKVVDTVLTPPCP